jgi:hypothetical protein
VSGMNPFAALRVELRERRGLKTGVNKEVAEGNLKSRG